MIKLIIPGIPIAKARPRFYRRGKNVGTYNSQQTEEGRFMLECKEQFNKHRSVRQLLEGPLWLTLFFYLPRPKAHYGTGRNAGKLKPSAPKEHITTPDLDNLVKFTKDCLNGIAWVDDSQIVSLTADKIYASVPQTAICISTNGFDFSAELTS